MLSETEPIDGEFTEPSTTALAVRPSTSLSIDVERMVVRRKEFHDFVQRVLKVDVHYGIPKDKNGQPIKAFAKPFLWQAGAEEVLSAFGCRPRYSNVFRQADPATNTVNLIQKCEAVHMETGVVMGEAEGAAAGDEFSTACNHSAIFYHDAGLQHDGFINCPEHGRMKAKVYQNRGNDKLICTGRNPEPFHKLLHNCLMRANKRAFVACARTLGCASEFFTQDEDMVTGQRLGNDEYDRADDVPDMGPPVDTRGAAGPTVVGDKWQDEQGDWHLHCRQHGPSKGKLWDRGKSVACTRRDQQGWCEYKVPIDGGNPEVQAPHGRTDEDIKAAYAKLAGAGVEADDLKEYMTADGYKFTERQKVTKSVVMAWCLQHGKGADDWAKAVLEWFDKKYPPRDSYDGDAFDTRAVPPSPSVPNNPPPFDASDYRADTPLPKPVVGSMLLEAAVGPPRAAVNCPATMRDKAICHVYDPATELHCHREVFQYSEYGMPLCEAHAAEWVRDGATLSSEKPSA